MKLRKITIKKISNRLILMFLATTTIIFSIFVFVITSLFSDKLTAEINTVSRQQMEFANALLDNKIKEIWDYYFSLVNKQQIQETMSNLTSASSAKDLDQLQTVLKKAINDTDRKKLNIRSAFIISDTNNILDPLYSLDTYQWLVNDNPEFEKFLDSQLTLRISAPNSFPFQNENANNLHLNSTITCFGRLYSKENYRNLGYVAINLNRNSLFTELEEVFRDTWTQFYIIDNDQNIIYSNPLISDCTADLKELLSGDYSAFGQRISINDTTVMK